MIEVSHLSKTFVKYEKEAGLWGLVKGFVNAKKILSHAVDDVSFTINDGDIVGYIGANGAGKSTTIKMLTGILTPTTGNIKVNGIVPHENRIANAKNIGVVFGQRTQLWWDLPLVESFSILKEIYEVSDEDFKSRMALFNEILELDTFIKSPVRTLSLGQRMRADIAASLLHNPKVLYLDEPTIGLDVNAKHRMRDAIKAMNAQFKTTVILTTHDLDDIEELCSRILIIDKGQIIYDGSLHTIKEKYGSAKTILFQTKDKFVPSFDLATQLNLPHDALKVSNHDNVLEVTFDKRQCSTAQVTQAVMNQIEVVDIEIQEVQIETIVGRIYQEGKV